MIYFSLEVSERTFLPTARDRLPVPLDAKKARTAADKVRGKILLSFGGNARSKGFGAMVSTKARRKKFLDELNKILEKYQFDGVDYNWEYPASDLEWRNWALLMKESKEALLGGKDRNIVTFTMYLDPAHYSVIERYQLLQDADFVHCMAYDQHGKHSTYQFAESGLQYAKQKSLAFLHKFTLGLPFYARDIRNGEPKTFYDLVKEIPNEVDDLVGTDYYNSADTLRKKVRLAREYGAGGVMIWELGQDLQPFTNEKSLLRAIGHELHKNDDDREEM